MCYVCGGYQPSMAIYIEFLMSSWPHLDNLKPILHDDGYFLVKSDKESNDVEIICGGNTMLDKRFVLIRKWDDKFDFKRDILHVIPVWIRLLNLPKKFWGAK